MQYGLQLLSEYVYTFDTNPLHLSKHLADRRKLNDIPSVSIYRRPTQVVLAAPVAPPCCRQSPPPHGLRATHLLLIRHPGCGR